MKRKMAEVAIDKITYTSFNYLSCLSFKYNKAVLYCRVVFA